MASEEKKTKEEVKEETPEKVEEEAEEVIEETPLDKYKKAGEVAKSILAKLNEMVKPG
ncbi:MAG: hypothetical protein HeimAB125_14770, partial [Candidatus Heimdallarchaeota archaeon AB_125]